MRQSSKSDNEHPQCKWSVCPHLLLCLRGRRSRLMWRGRPSIVYSAWEDFGGRLDYYSPKTIWTLPFWRDLCNHLSLLIVIMRQSSTSDNEHHPQCKWSVCPHLSLCLRGRWRRLMWRWRPSIVDSVWEDFGGRLADIREEINWKKNVLFRALPELPNPPPWPQFGQLGPLFSEVEIQDLKVSLELRILYILYNILYICNLKNS